MLPPPAPAGMSRALSGMAGRLTNEAQRVLDEIHEAEMRLQVLRYAHGEWMSALRIMDGTFLTSHEVVNILNTVTGAAVMSCIELQHAWCPAVIMVCTLQIQIKPFKRLETWVTASLVDPIDPCGPDHQATWPSDVQLTAETTDPRLKTRGMLIHPASTCCSQ